VTESDRPLVTFALFAYNQEGFIREAVEGTFAQTYSPLEIILSDDCSTDGTFKIMKEMGAAYTGPHQLILNRNEANQGIGGHINTVMKLAGGGLIVVGAGDDISNPQRVGMIVNEYLLSARKYVAIYSALTTIDDQSKEIQSERWQKGETADVVKMVAGRSGIYGCSAAYSADLFKSFGVIDPDVLHEDMVLPFRAAICGEIRFMRSRLVKYRLHGANQWNRNNRPFSKKEYLHRLAKYLPDETGVARQRIADLERAKSMSLKVDANSGQVERTLRDHLRRSQLELDLLQSESHFAAMSRTLRLLCYASSYKRGVRWLYLRFLPEIKWLNRMLLK
jgi:glycosyltransferase involved in cell wall biosynthesis